jgi:hypothetical protein
MELTPEQVGRVYREVELKHRATDYLRAPILELTPPTQE